MLLLWVFLWLISVILVFSDPKNTIIRWSAAIAFFSGCGGLAVTLRERIRFLVSETNHSSIFAEHTMDWFADLCSSLAHYVSPFCLLIFSLLYTERIKGSNQKKWTIITILFMPVLMMYIISPKVVEADFTVLTGWVALYVVLSNFLLINDAFIEKQTVLKRQRILTCLIICPTTLFSLMTNYVFISLGFVKTWEHNAWMISIGFIGFLYFWIRYGFLGIQLRFEKQRLDVAIQAATSGTALLNHTIKNEAGKIHILADRITYNMTESTCSIENDIDL
ncbi:MAG: hypothetical protein WD907_01375, partial [Bacilli bacterium]